MKNGTQLSEDEDEGGSKATWGAPKARFRHLKELGDMGLFQQSRRNEDHGDVLPTPLTFQDNELVYAWARVDWEAKAMGNLEDLLARFGSVRVQVTSP
jgi:hypothetical protein